MKIPFDLQNTYKCIPWILSFDFGFWFRIWPLVLELDLDLRYWHFLGVKFSYVFRNTSISILILGFGFKIQNIDGTLNFSNIYYHIGYLFSFCFEGYLLCDYVGSPFMRVMFGRCHWPFIWTVLILNIEIVHLWILSCFKVLFQYGIVKSVIHLPRTFFDES